MHLRVRVLSPSLPGSRTKVDDAAARMAAVFVGRCLGGLDDDDDKAVIPPLPPSLPPSRDDERTTKVKSPRGSRLVQTRRQKTGSE